MARNVTIGEYICKRLQTATVGCVTVIVLFCLLTFYSFSFQTLCRFRLHNARQSPSSENNGRVRICVFLHKSGLLFHLYWTSFYFRNFTQFWNVDYGNCYTFNSRFSRDQSLMSGTSGSKMGKAAYIARKG